MSRNFHQEFIIHPVGQGLFYSGKITYGNDIKFRMVFDCGSLTGGACQEEVNLYRDHAFLKEKQIDLLTISHFDADHVNQIGVLLDNGVLIKRLVMPFLTFEERLFLVLKYLGDGSDLPNEDFFLSFLIDPLGTINDNLDSDSEIYLVDSGPDRPGDSDNETEGDIGESGNGNDEGRFEFDFQNKKMKLDTGENGFRAGRRIFKIEDSDKGTVSSGSLKLMDFLFYKRKISEDDVAFYNEVAKLFYAEYSIDPSIPSNDLLEAIVAQVKQIKSAPQIKQIFGDAKKTLGITGINLKDLNTTALCMLHRNLSGIWRLTNRTREMQYMYFDAEPEVYSIHKFSMGSRLETYCRARYHWFRHHRIADNRFIFPNVLLTSDTFLLTEDQVDPFLKHFEKYWSDFWLFQIPHHGSDKSSNDILLSHITEVDNCFINYGVGNRDSHPSPSVIHHLVTTGNSAKVMPVNQILGLRFSLSL